MKKYLLALPILALTACGAKATYEPDLDALLQNPLFAEYYTEMLVESMAELEIYEDPIIEDPTKKRIAEETRKEWHAKALAAKKLQRQGAVGDFIPMKEFANGEVLYKDNVLYFGPKFDATPGPSLHVYLTTAVDPRDVLFPDDSAIDLGLVKTVLGAHQYDVPPVEDPTMYRTVVLWDTTLDRLHAFAQITPLYE